MRVLVDTSVWVSHFKQPNETLINLLLQDRVMCHEWIIGELACGTPPKREQTLEDLSNLEFVTKATHQEVLHTIEKYQLNGKGCGYIDIALLASVMLTFECTLWTLDKQLGALGDELGIVFVT